MTNFGQNREALGLFWDWDGLILLFWVGVFRVYLAPSCAYLVI